MSETIFYKKRLEADESGLIVITDRYMSIHETPCFHYCIPEHLKRWPQISKKKDETELQWARRSKILKRIHKGSSRIAFPTEDEALQNLKFLKMRQITHLERQIAFNKYFLDAGELEKVGRYSVVPESRDLVHEHLCFD